MTTWGNHQEALGIGSSSTLAHSNRPIIASVAQQSVKPKPLAQVPSWSINAQNTYPQLQQHDDSSNNTNRHDENAVYSKKEQSAPLKTTTPAALPPEQDKSAMQLPPHIRMLAPHRRIKEIARWEAGRKQAAAAAEAKKQQEKKRQDDNLMLKGVVTETQKGHNAAWSSLVSNEMSNKKLPPPFIKSSTNHVTSKRWIMTGEDNIQLENGRIITSDRLRLVSEDHPAVTKFALSKEDVVYVTGEIDKSPLPQARKEWFTSSPDVTNNASLENLVQHKSESTDPISSSLIDDTGSGSGSPSGSGSGAGGGATLAAWDGSAKKPAPNNNNQQMLKKLNAQLPQWDNTGQKDKKDQKDTQASGGTQWSKDQWSDPNKIWTNDNWASTAKDSTQKAKDTQETPDTQSAKKELPMVLPTPLLPPSEEVLGTSIQGSSNNKGGQDGQQKIRVKDGPAAEKPPNPEDSTIQPALAKTLPQVVEEPVLSTKKPTPSKPVSSMSSVKPPVLPAKAPILLGKAPVFSATGPSLQEDPFVDTPTTVPSPIVIPDLLMTEALPTSTPTPTAPATPSMPGADSDFSANTAVGTVASDVNSDILDVNPDTSHMVMTGHWVNTVSRYGPTDWLNSTFIDEDAAAAKIFSVQRKLNLTNGEVEPPAFDGATELTADRQRLPTLLRVTDFGRAQRRSLMGMVAGTDGRLRMGAAFRSQHGDGGPMEPTGALYNLRMKIICNFAQQCRDAEHTAEAALQIPVFAVPETPGQAGPSAPVPTPRLPPILNPTPPTLPKVIPLCHRCSAGHDFAMREQHGRLFLERVLLPLSERSSYTDMQVHVNTCVAERIFAESGLGLGKDGACPWEDIKTMPIYEDYQGALTLATHRQKVMSSLPMGTDKYGFLYGKKR
ncbi:hypothetical protein SEUCBS139899_000499 [Sporothrix eucalyptigena]